MTDNKSDVPNEGFHLEGESLKQFTSRNVDLETQLKAGIMEDPDEETKSDKNALT